MFEKIKKSEILFKVVIFYDPKEFNISNSLRNSVTNPTICDATPFFKIYACKLDIGDVCNFELDDEEKFIFQVSFVVICVD